MRSIPIQRDASLIGLSTFRLSASTRERVDLEHPDQIQAALDTELPTLILGGGSNTLFVNDFPGRVIVNRLHGVAFDATDNDTVCVTAAAGEDWHALVLQSIKQNLWGLENLALIPGSVGAAPMQNIGAYGVELARCLDSVQIYDRSTQTTDWLPAEQCGLSYRDSRFKSADAGRFIILAVRLNLSSTPDPILHYPALQAELKRTGQPQPDHPRTVAAAVMRIRRSKLPNPTRIANAGSFFKNPLVTTTQAAELLKQHPDLPHWPDGQKVKLSAAWMIDQLGWRSKSVGDAQVYPKHALVLTNAGQSSAKDLLSLARQIRKDMQEHYGIRLEHEPQIIGAQL
ncbi:MAG: UDP-N-acetylmuramate dehydrogenase [Pseudomonadota bacterium]